MASLEQWQEYNQDYLGAIDANMSLDNTLDAMDAVEQDLRKIILVSDIPEENRNSYESEKQKRKDRIVRNMGYMLDAHTTESEKDSYLKTILRCFDPSVINSEIVYNNKEYSARSFFTEIKNWTIEIDGNAVAKANINRSSYAIKMTDYHWTRYIPLIESMNFD